MMTTTLRLGRLREAMARHGLDAWLVTSNDPHLSEYTSERWKTRAWLSGFHGSAGNLVVTADTAGLWVDPRYHMRADSETAGTPVTVFKEGLPGTSELVEWLASSLPGGATVGFDPETVSAALVLHLRERLGAAGVSVEPVAGVVDAIWPDRPVVQPRPIVDYPVEFAGESAVSKLDRLRGRLAAVGAEAMLITALDETAWLLNLRGDDVPMNPVALVYSLVLADSVDLFVHDGCVTPGLRESLAAEVTIRPYGEVEAALRTLPAGTALLLDPERTRFDLYQATGHLQRVSQPSPAQLLKAHKNEIELAGAREAHAQDGAALVKLLHWLATTDVTAETEISVADKLEEFRAGTKHYRGPGFGTIVGFGPNSSVGHYQSDPLNPQPLGHDALLLIDTGGQYLHGTTDTTRTVCLGQPTPEQVRVYTTVLKSLIMASNTRFPRGTTGQRLDAIARFHIWANGWECRHGIGHGVGHYLHVHEGPQRINKVNEVEFEPGMVNSCEPGVYFEGDFGVRLENVIVTAPAETTVFGPFYRFETLTPCPFERELIDAGSLTEQERSWLDAYHRWVVERVSPYLNAEVLAWLEGRVAAV